MSGMDKKTECVWYTKLHLKTAQHAVSDGNAGDLQRIRADVYLLPFLENARDMNCPVEFQTLQTHSTLSQGYDAIVSFNYVFGYSANFAATNGGVRFDAEGQYVIPIFISAQNFGRDSTICTSTFTLSRGTSGPVITPDPVTITDCSPITINDYVPPIANGTFTNITGAQIRYISFLPRAYSTPSNGGVVSSFSPAVHHANFDVTEQLILEGVGVLPGIYYFVESYTGEPIVFYQESANSTLSEFSVSGTTAAPYLLSGDNVCSNSPCGKISVGDKTISFTITPSVVTEGYLNIFSAYELGIFLYLNCDFTVSAFFGGISNGVYVVPAIVLSRNLQTDSRVCNVMFDLTGEPCHASVGTAPLSLTNCSPLTYTNIVGTNYDVATLNGNEVTIYLVQYDRSGFSTPGYSGSCKGFIDYPPAFDYTSTAFAIEQLRTNATLTDGNLTHINPTYRSLKKGATCYFMEQVVGPAIWCQSDPISELLFYVGHFFTLTQEPPLLPKSQICFIPSLCPNVTIEEHIVGSIAPVLRLGELNPPCIDLSL